MFDSVLGRGASAPSRFGTGAVASVLLHAGLAAGVLFLSTRAQDNAVPERDIPPLVVFRDSKPAGGSRPAAAPQAARPRMVRPQSKTPLRMPSTMPPPAVDPVTPPPPQDPPPPADGDGDPNGGPISTRPGDGSHDLGPGDGSGSGGGGGGGEVSIFTEGMTRPVQLEGHDPQYTREALEARVEGKIIAKCVITTAGRLESCRIIKSLPLMDQAVLAALASRRYTPVMYQGRPAAVQYIFEIRLMLPR